jgi:hypothetical protein
VCLIALLSPADSCSLWSAHWFRVYDVVLTTYIQNIARQRALEYGKVTNSDRDVSIANDEMVVSIHDLSTSSNPSVEARLDDLPRGFFADQFEVCLMPGATEAFLLIIKNRTQATTTRTTPPPDLKYGVKRTAQSMLSSAAQGREGRLLVLATSSRL